MTMIAPTVNHGSPDKRLDNPSIDDAFLRSFELLDDQPNVGG